MRTQTAIAAAWLVGLASCTPITLEKDEDIHLRMSLGGAYSDFVDELDGVKGHGYSDEHFAGRVEFARQTFSRNIQAGVRAEVGSMESSPSQSELETEHYSLGLVVRGYLPVSETLRPYFELGGGVRYAEQEVVIPGISSDKGDGAGGYFGAAIGVEMTVAESVGLFMQGDYAHSDIGLDGVSFRTNETGLFAGAIIRF